MLFVTATVPHELGEPLAVVWDRLHVRRRALLRHRWWRDAERDGGVVGKVIAQEPSWSLEGGWHPHLHMLLFTGSPWEASWRDKISERLGSWFRFGRRGVPEPEPGGVGTLPPRPVDVSQVEEGNEGKVAEYMAAGAAKGASESSVDGSLFGMVRSDPKRWREFEAAANKRHPVRWSPGLAGLFGIDRDSDRDPLPAEHVEVADLSRDEWRQVFANGSVAALRIAARNAVHQGATSVHWTP